MYAWRINFAGASCLQGADNITQRASNRVNRRPKGWFGDNESGGPLGQRTDGLQRPPPVPVNWPLPSD